ncbi:MAG: putative Ig domain-containing protein [Chloroflexota bacterium]
MKKLIILVALLFFVVSIFSNAPLESRSSQSNAAYTLLDNFEAFNIGSVNMQRDWVGNEPGAADGGVITEDGPDFMGGKRFKNEANGFPNRGSAYRRLGDDGVANGGQATFYFQLAIDEIAAANISIGLSDQAAPPIRLSDDPSHFEVEINISGSGLRVRNGNAYQAVSTLTLSDGTLYHVWLLVDAAQDTFVVVIDDAFQAPTAVSTASGSTFQFRNGSDSTDLQTFVIQNLGSNQTNTYLDNLYVADGNEADGLSAPAADYQVIEQFDNLQEALIGGQNGWSNPTQSAEVVADPQDPANSVLRLVNANTITAKASPLSIDDGSEGTLFFRMYRSGTVNGFAGLSDLQTPAEWVDFEAQIGAQADAPDTLRVRDQALFRSLGPETFYNQSWYCVWLVADNGSDRFKAYVEGGRYDQPTRLDDGGTNLFGFRNGTANPLQALLIRTGPNSTGQLYIDDIFIDAERENLTRPAGVCPESDSGGEPGLDPNEPLSNPLPEPVLADGTTVQLKTVLTVPSSGSNPRTRINYMYHAKDGSGRLFVNDLRGELYVIPPGSNLSASEYLDLKDYFPQLKTVGSQNAGFSTFAFHPDFNNNGLFYTVHYEFPNGPVDFDHPNTANQDARTHSVIIEWKADDPSSNQFVGSQREVMRLVQNTALHGVQLVEFNRIAAPGSADYGMLYVSLGDSEQEPFFTNVAQDLTYPQGKILRIDPQGTNSANGQYGIPADNPFISDSNGILDEIYAYGFRNPIRFDWDPITKKMLVANVGQRNAEEVELILPGLNYGWNEREGTFRFDPNRPDDVFPLPEGDNPDFVYPVAQYDHDEGLAIIGGFVYRGTLMPRLYGAYIFGDIVRGHLFYVSVNELTLGEQAEIHRLTVLDDGGDETTFIDLVGAPRADLRFGLDADGEIYVMSKQDGVIRRMVSDQSRENNQAPSIFQIDPQVTQLGQPAALQVEASDNDGDVLNYSATGLPNGLTIDPSTGVISGSAQQNGSFFATVRVTDSRGGEDSRSVNWIVNASPTIAPLPNRSNQVDEVVSLKIEAVDPDGHPLLFTASQLPDGLTIGGESGVVSGRLQQGGTFTPVIVVKDDFGGSVSVAFEWVVNSSEPNSGNRAPSLAPLSDRLDQEGDPVSLSASASDPEGDLITYSAENLPPGVVLNQETGEMTGSLTQNGVYLVKMTVEDSSQASMSLSFVWRVNTAPRLPTVADRNNVLGDTIDTGFVATDGDLDNRLLYGATGLPTGLSINLRSGQVFGKISGEGTYQVELSVDDQYGGIDTKRFEWRVSGRPSGSPTLTPLNDLYAYVVGDVVSIDIGAFDPEGGDLTFGATNLPPGLKIDPKTGTVSGRAYVVGSFRSMITVTDSENFTDQAFLNFEVVDGPLSQNVIFLPTIR